VKEVAVEVERVDRIELDDVHQVDAHELAAAYAQRPVVEVKCDGVDRVDLVVLVEVRVERVLHHDHLVGLGTALRRVDDEGAVQALCDVSGEGRGVAVVEVQSERPCVELIGELLADIHEAAADVLSDPGSAVHHGGMDAVEVDRVGVSAGVDEVDPELIALPGSKRRPGNAAVVRPRVELHAWNDLDLLVVSDELPLAQRAAAGEAPRLAPVEVTCDRTWVEAVHLRIDRSASDGKAGVRRARNERVVLARRFRCRFRDSRQLGDDSGSGNRCRGPKRAAPGEGPAHDPFTLSARPKRNLRQALRLFN
jgi:hypothetical protein